MATIQSAAKRNRQSEKRRVRNKHYRTIVRHATRKLREALASKDAKKIQEAFRQACKTVDRAKSKGVLHARNAARRISRLATEVAKATARTAAT